MNTREAAVSRIRALEEASLEDIVEPNDVVLAEFMTEWCGPCTRMAPVLESIAADTDAVVVTVDVESHLPTAIEHGAQ